MPVLRLDIEYDGAGFAGWAEQPGQRTIERVLRDALDVAIRTYTDLRVAGRTDAGVHASGQVVSVVIPDDAHGPDPERVMRSLTALLPADVAVRALSVAPAGFDARADAVSRVYEYRIVMGQRSPLRRNRVLWHAGRPLDRTALDACAALTVGRHDFRAFTPTETGHTFFERTVIACEWGDQGDELVLRIEANAFLWNMVRVLVGSMLECARGRREVGWYSAALAGAPRSAAGPTAPPHPLTLVAVRY
ncbi:MAG: tRNA pseudouridine(38-40) synthase TruA [Thermoleophilia bacterium]|nr:tRNA pseudouridine(38-40) synthase TruA [Thermoleophilia bacterium]